MLEYIKGVFEHYQGLKEKKCREAAGVERGTGDAVKLSENRRMRTEQFYIEDHILMHSLYPTPELHAHTALHLIIPVEGRLDCHIRDQRTVSAGIFIDSDVPHTAASDSGQMLVFLFDAVSSMAEMIRKTFLAGQEYCLLPEELAERIQQIVRAESELAVLDHDILQLCGFDKLSESDMDERISETIAYMRAQTTVSEEIFDELCDRVCLSRSRFSHLFKENTGLSFSHYLVILKMRKFYENYLAGRNITDAAVEAGFSSPSHFAEVCRRQFGISFSEFVKSTK